MYIVYIQYNIPLVHYYYIAQVGKWMMSTAFSILFNSMISVVEYQFCVYKFLCIQNWDDFCLKVTRFKENFDIFLNGGMQKSQKWENLNFPDHFTVSKIDFIFLKRIFLQ